MYFTIIFWKCMPFFALLIDVPSMPEIVTTFNVEVK